MTDPLDPLVADLEVELALRGFAGRVDDGTHHVWRRKAAPSMRVRVRRDGGRSARLRGDLRCDGVGVLRFGRRSGKETLGVDAVLSTIDAWLARARRAESSAAPTPGGLADEDRWITAVELTPAGTPPDATEPEPAPEPDVGPEPTAPRLPDTTAVVATTATLPAVVDDLTGELRTTLAENRSLHRELADARERAARAETESAFLAQRLQEVRETAAALGELRRRLEDTRAGEAEARARADVAEAELDRLRRELERARDTLAAPTSRSAGSTAGDAPPSAPPQPRPATSATSPTSLRSGRSTTIDALRRFFGPGRRGT